MKEILAVGMHIQPDDELVIGDLETLHIISDPLRLRLLECIIDQPKAIKQIAAELGIDQIKLYYHFKLLEKHGLVRVVEERVISGIVEKVYRARAKTLRVREGLLTVAGKLDAGTDAMLGDVSTSRAQAQPGHLHRQALAGGHGAAQRTLLCRQGKCPPDTRAGARILSEY